MVPIWEWRCPEGERCGKKCRLLYKKHSEEEAVTAGTWHLYDKAQHPDPEYTWEEAQAKAPEGITESTREIHICLDENGTEVDAPRSATYDALCSTATDRGAELESLGHKAYVSQLCEACRGAAQH